MFKFAVYVHHQNRCYHAVSMNDHHILKRMVRDGYRLHGVIHADGPNHAAMLARQIANQILPL